MEFNKYRLSDIADVQTGPFGSQLHKEDYVESGIPIITVEHLGENKIIHSNLPKVNKEDWERLSKYALKKNDIVFSRVGSVDRCALVSPDEENWLFSGRCLRVRVKNLDVIDPKYLSYYFATKKFKRYIRSIAVGATMPSINTKILSEIQIEIPDIDSQREIAALFYSLDSKKWVNESIIKNLEHVSSALFKQWFVDFEFPNEEGKPYKSSGGEMVQSELGNIPKNWIFSYFSNYVKHTIGGDWGKENVEKNYVEQVSIIRGADIPELIKGTDNKVPTRFILKKNYENKKLLPGDIVIEISGGSPTQSTGRSIFINKNIISRYNDKVLCTNFCRIIRPVDFNKGIWLQMYINYLYKKNVFFNFENGTTGIKNLDLNAVLNKYKIISPSEDTIHLFSERMRVILDSIQSLGMENKRLANLRDTLLPKLLSGEIEIPDELEV